MYCRYMYVNALILVKFTLCKTHHNVNDSWSTSFFCGSCFIYNCFQIRAVNDFDLFGNWSEPILLLDVNSTTVPSRSPSSGESLVWVYVLAVVVFLLMVAILIVLFVCIYRHFCFHRGIKYVSYTFTNTYSQLCLMCTLQAPPVQLGEQNGRNYLHPIPPPVY